MNRIRVKTILCVALAAVMVAALVIASLALIPRTRSEEILPNPNVAIDDGNGALSVYVSGAEVEEAKDGGYYVPAGKEFTVTVVNETGVFSALTVSDGSGNTIASRTNAGEYDYGCVVEGLSSESGTITVRASARGVTSADRGKLFSLSYPIDDAETLIALANILAGGGSAADYLLFGFGDGASIGTEEKAAADGALRYGYYRLTSNIIVNDSRFDGLGSRGGMPFQGCFDFDGHYAYINISKTDADEISFTSVQKSENTDVVQVADLGFFSYIYGGADENGRPCLVRGADVRGSIAVNTVSSAPGAGEYRLHAGGIAGSAGKDIVFDGVRSQVSVSVQAGRATLLLGGLFGFSSASVDEWSQAVYEGDYGSISGITQGSGANVFVGGLAGVVQNAYANGFSNTARSTSFVANANASLSGSAYVGGLAGAVYVGPSLYKFAETDQPRSVTLRRFASSVRDSFVLSSVIDNESSTAAINPDDFSAGSAGAVAGGFVGGIYVEQSGSSSHTVTVSHVNFTGGSVPLTVTAQTLDGGSRGAAFAGGLIGYIQTDSAAYIRYEVSENSAAGNPANSTFACDTEILATQNGVGPAYAGGLFGYNAFNLTDSGATDGLHFRLTASEHAFRVTAMQSALSSAGGKNLYDVSAGLYSSRLQAGYALSDFTLYADNAEVTAGRTAGSAATGDIAAGGFAGKASGDGAAAAISNVTMQFGEDVSVNALGYSYDSQYAHSSGAGADTGNNVYAGGFIGYIQNYGVADNGQATASNAKLSNITVRFGSSSGYAVRGVQNAASGNADYKTEGYVGGVFGMLANCSARNLIFEGAPGGSLIYFTSSNNPNTASVGGLVGATRSGANTSASYGSGNLSYSDYAIAGGTVENAHVVGRAYYAPPSEGEITEEGTDPTAVQSGHNYDIYVGGAIGVFGSERGNISATVSDIYVYDTVVEAIGEQYMRTYAGGVFGGIWYSGSLSAADCAVIGSNVTASSVSFHAHAGGIAGLLQSCSVTACHVLDSSVAAATEADTVYMQTGRNRDWEWFGWGDWYPVYGDVSIFGSVGGIYGNLTGSNQAVSGCYSNAYLSISGVHTRIGGIGADDGGETSRGTNYFVYENAGTREGFADSGGTAYAIYLHGNYENSLELTSGGEEDIFPNVPYDNVISSDENIVSVREETRNEGSGWNPQYVDYNVATGEASGTAYASVVVTLANNDTYTLCSYPVIVDGETPVSGFGLGVYDADGYSAGSASEIKEGDTDGYFPYSSEDGVEKYTYVRVNSGSDKVQNLLVAPRGNLADGTPLAYFPVLAAVYDASGAESSAAVGAGYVEAILGRCTDGNQKTPSAFNGSVTLSFAGEAGSQTHFTLTPSPTLAERTVIVVQYEVDGTKYGVIAEFIPNEVNGVTAVPGEDTQPMGSYTEGEGENKDYFYIYAPGDTVRFDALVSHIHGDRNSYLVEVEFEGEAGNGDDVGSSVSIVSANGTVDVPAYNAGGPNIYAVTCNVLGTGFSDTVYIEVREEIEDVSYTLSGANVSSDRKAVKNTDYTFTATPQAGYGLAPAVAIDGTGVTNITEGAGGTATWNGRNISYTYDKNTGAYAFTLPAEMMTADVESLTIQISFAKVYNIVFIPNYTGGNASDDVFTVTVVAGEKLNATDAWYADFLEWRDGKIGEDGSRSGGLIDSRYGFDFAGFYLASEANSSAAYGSSFEEMLKAGMTANGPIMFYARWTYNVLVETPEGVTVSSGLSSSLVQENGIVPIDDRHGFSFRVRVTAPGGWAGETRFSVYIRNAEDGQYVDITDYFADGANGWFIDADELLELARTNGSGLLYIRVYSDSLTVWQGDSAAQEIDSVRSDGVFTVEYSANYSGAQAPGDVSLLFNVNDGADELDLPADTSLRLYYLQNGAAVWAGSYTVPEGGASSVVLAGKGCVFTALKGFDAFPADRSGISSETFYLVVTLPDNKVNFEAQLGSAASFASSVAVSAAEPDGDLDLEGYGSVAGELAGDSSLQRPTVSAAEKQLQYYRADVRSVTAVNAAAGSYALTYTVTAGCPGIADAADAPEDVRHANLRYVWEIRRADGGAIGTVWLNGADDTRKNALLQSVSAVYFAAAEDTETLVLDGTDYVVSLLAVRNTQYPGAGTVLWTKTLSA